MKLSSLSRKQKISSLDITVLFRQLATLISSGVPIVQSLEVLRQSNHDHFSLQKLIQSIKHEIENGKTLMNSLCKFPRYFDNLTCHLVNAGEQSCTLDKILKRIASHKEKSHALKRQIKQALFYPSLIFFTAIAMSITMLTFVVPRFAELFQSMHKELPAFTQLIIFLSTLIRDQYWLILPFLILSVITFYYFKVSPQFKNKIDYYILKIPFLNTIIKKIILARLTRTLAITYSAGIPITQALKIIANIAGNTTYSKAITTIQTRVTLGQQLHTAMRMNALFPAMPIQMIKIGEESGTLEHMLEKIAELYESDIDHLISNLNQLLEPLIMITLGVLIGGLVIAMYLPIFKLGTVI